MFENKNKFSILVQGQPDTDSESESDSEEEPPLPPTAPPRQPLPIDRLAQHIFHPVERAIRSRGSASKLPNVQSRIIEQKPGSGWKKQQ
jgi:hypothetical protein